MKNLLVLVFILLILVTAVFLLPEPAAPPSGVDGAAAMAEPAATASAITVIRNVRLFDGEQVHAATNLLLRDGLVHSIGSELDVPAAANVIDATGMTAVPGLIDAHVHSVSSARADALRFGVTTMLDMFRPPFDFDQVHAERESAGPTEQADLFSAGFLATVAGGHGTQYGINVPTLAGPEAAFEWVAVRKAEGSDWIKIIIEPGWGKRALPTLDAATVTALIAAAHANELMAVAHVSSYDDALLAIESGIDGLVHLFGDREVDAPFLAAAQANGIFVVPTTPVLAAIHGHDDTDWIPAHPLLGPRLTAAQRESLAMHFPAPDDDGSAWSNVQANVIAMHAAGIPILAGSDAQNPATTYGASLHHDLRLLVGAGLTPLAALRAATSASANAFGLQGRGCLKPGCRADLLLVNGNPLLDIEATAMIDAVWKNGHRIEFKLPVAPLDSASADATPQSSVDLLSEPTRWMAAADNYMGGNSTANIAWVDEHPTRRLSITGQVTPGYAFPYAGAMWFTNAIPMQPVDHSAMTQLVLEFDGPDSDYQVLLFSGANQSLPPVQVPVQAGRSNTIQLDSINLLDLARLRAIGVFASGSEREVKFTIQQALLESM